MNIRRNLAIMMTQLCSLLLLCSGVRAQETLINFDDVPDGTVINTRYAGVTFSSPGGGDIYARSRPDAPSSPNVVLGPSAFDDYYGIVTATFTTPQLTVSIDARPIFGAERVSGPTWQHTRAARSSAGCFIPSLCRIMALAPSRR